jgi:hypothetical protein
MFRNFSMTVPSFNCLLKSLVNNVIVPLQVTVAILIFAACSRDKKSDDKVSEMKNAVESVLTEENEYSAIPEVATRIAQINAVLKSETPVLLLQNADQEQLLAQQIALKDTAFCKNIFDPKTKQAFRNEIFNVYQARPQEVSGSDGAAKIYKVEMYNYALNAVTTAFVDIHSQSVAAVSSAPQSQPDIPVGLKDLALKIAVNSKEVADALGYKPGEADALMANTKTSLNNTRCEQSMHLCVAPTFIKDDKALWAIVDLTDFKLVGIRWTNTGTTGPVKRISERKLKFDKIMECFCKQVTHLKKQNWDLNYVITTSDGMRISEVKYNDKLIVNNAKIVDWHVSYSNTDGFGYSDAVGCPEFSQAAVIAVSTPRVADIVENGKVTGFALEQNFSSEQWPLPCNYNYLQRYEFYTDGRFRSVAASLGRGCGNNGTYRPVMRIAFAGDRNTLSEWNETAWTPWTKEQWKLQNPRTKYFEKLYQYKISDEKGNGYYVEPGKGQFNDGGRGDNAYLFVTKQHLDKDEGEKDLVTIGPCCNTDYRQGPEKFIEANPEGIQNTGIVLWYVPQIKNDDTKGREYCWAESDLVNGVYKTKTFPCMCGPMFVPLKI